MNFSKNLEAVKSLCINISLHTIIDCKMNPSERRVSMRIPVSKDMTYNAISDVCEIQSFSTLLQASKHTKMFINDSNELVVIMRF